MSSTITVRLDDRLRLAGVLLAAGDWPEREQREKAYKPHRVAEHAHRYFAPHSSHPAVSGALAVVGDGSGLDTLYAHALNAAWPDELAGHVASFRSAARLDEFWTETESAWTQAADDALAVLSRTDLRGFLIDLIGPQDRAFVFVPNLLYPGRRRVGCASASEVVVASHTPIAWGTSHPWRFSERPDESLALIGEAFARFLFAEALSLSKGHADRKAQAEVLGAAAAVLFLRQAEGEAAGDQYMVMEKKARGLKTLPAAVAALEPLLADRRAGKYPNGVNDYSSQLVFLAQGDSGVKPTR
jgi:hypothetical protein